MSSLSGSWGPTGKASGLSGTGLRQITLPKMSPQKSSLYSGVMEAVRPGILNTTNQLSQLAGGGNEETWRQLEAPAMRQFNALQGDISSRFSGGFGGGGAGARHSSGFQNAMGEEASSLAEKLQAQRLGIQSGAMEQLRNLYQSLLGQDEFDTFLTEKKKKMPLWKSILGAGLPIAGGAIGGAFGGPMGMAMGSQIGSGLGGAITGKGGGMDFSGLGRLPTKWGS